MLSDNNARYMIQQIHTMFPVKGTKLTYSNPFELLIAVILSAQTTDAGVNKVTPRLFADFPTPEAMAQATSEQLIPYIKAIGLYKNKSKYIHQTAQALVTRFDGEVPGERKALESLPGVGRKTASVVLSNGFDVPAFAVDTHVARVCKHHGIVDADASIRAIEDRVCELVPPEDWLAIHQSMIEFGRNVCIARRPQCHLHPELCDLPDKSELDKLSYCRCEESELS